MHTMRIGSYAPGCILTYNHFSATAGVWDCGSSVSSKVLFTRREGYPGTCIFLLFSHNVFSRQVGLP